MKKIFIIIFIIVIIISIGIGAYFGWKKSKEILTPPAFNERKEADYQLPQSVALKSTLESLSDRPVFGYWLSFATSSPEAEIFYITPSGLILKAVKGGDDEIISDKEIENLAFFEPSADGKKIIVGFNGLNAVVFEMFDMEQKVWTPLDGAAAAAFSPDGGRIVFLKNSANAGASDLIIRNLDEKKKKETKLLKLNQKDFVLKWPASKKILLISKPSYLAKSEIWEVDAEKGTLKLFSEGTGLSVKWSKDGGIGLKFSLNSKNEGRLGIIDSNGVVKADLTIATLAEKCALNLAKIYCAVPKSYSAFGAPLLPDQYLKRAIYSDDAIFGIDIASNFSEKILDENRAAIDAVNLSVSDSGKALFFINRYDNLLYGLKL